MRERVEKERSCSATSSSLRKGLGASGALEADSTLGGEGEGVGLRGGEPAGS